jgi:hypothetical protein
MLQLLLIANVVPSLLIPSTLQVEMTCFSKTSVLTKPTSCHIPGDGILHSHCHESLKSYNVHVSWFKSKVIFTNTNAGGAS